VYKPHVSYFSVGEIKDFRPIAGYSPGLDPAIQKFTDSLSVR
jgi:hypothetical protein